MISVIGLAVLLFATTDVDDLFVLIALFADPKFGTRAIVVGQYLGIAALFAVSAALSAVSLVLSPERIGWLGLLPILIGLKRLFESPDSDERDEVGSTSAVFAVALVTIANGGDNIAVYTPAFATETATHIALIGGVFVVMTVLWLFVAHALVNHRQLGAIRRYGSRVAPLLLIGLGLRILYEAGDLRYFGG